MNKVEIEKGSRFLQLSRHKVPKVIHCGIVDKVYRNKNGRIIGFSAYSHYIGEDYRTDYHRKRSLTWNITSNSMIFDKDIPKEYLELIKNSLVVENNHRAEFRKDYLSKIKEIQSVTQKLLDENPKNTFVFQDERHYKSVVNFDYHKDGHGMNHNLISFDYNIVSILVSLGFIEKVHYPFAIKHGYYEFLDLDGFLKANFNEDLVPLDLIDKKYKDREDDGKWD